MSNNKQSSYEFLWEELKPFLPANYTVDESIKILSILKQAKAMHKEEHAATARDWWVEGASDAHKTSTGRHESFHDYYEKKFNQ